MLCSSCLAKEKRLHGHACPHCATPMYGGSMHKGQQRCTNCDSDIPFIDELIAMYSMEGSVRKAVHALKYTQTRAMATPIGESMVTTANLINLKVNVILPVPAHPKRTRSRGYNQAELIARNIARLTGLPIRCNLVKRVVNTPSLVTLSTRAERLKVIQDAFVANTELNIIKGARVLLVDDVATTGSTASEVSKVLKEAGAEAVFLLVFARELK